MNCFGGGGFGCGTVFKLAADGTETVLHAFAGQGDGAEPAGGLVEDQAGNLYGTTNLQGAAGCMVEYDLGCGTVFKLAPNGTETVLHSFAGGADGAYPYGGLVADGSGNLYGTTLQGGGSNCSGNSCGTVFKLKP